MNKSSMPKTTMMRFAKYWRCENRECKESGDCPLKKGIPPSIQNLILKMYKEQRWTTSKRETISKNNKFGHDYHSESYFSRWFTILKSHGLLEMKTAGYLLKQKGLPMQTDPYHKNEGKFYRIDIRKFVQYSLDAPPWFNDLAAIYFTDETIRNSFKGSDLVSWMQQIAFESCLTSILLKEETIADDKEKLWHPWPPLDDPFPEGSFAERMGKADEYGIYADPGSSNPKLDARKSLLICELYEQVNLELIKNLLHGSDGLKNWADWLRAEILIKKAQLKKIELKRRV